MFSSNTSQVSNDAVFVEDVFSTWLYTGNGSTQTITNEIDILVKGGMTWLKRRDAASDNFIYDSARAVSPYWHQRLITNQTVAQSNTGAAFTALSNGFSITNSTGANVSPGTYASWTFRKQPKFFDVVTWTGNDVNGRQITHNLGSTPGCIIVKSTSLDGTDWVVHHRSLGFSQVVYLNSTAAAETTTRITAATSTTFTISDASTLNSGGGTYVAYLFAHNAGGFGLTGTDNVISCGSYTGNGDPSNGPIVNLGWEPQWLLIKSSTSAQNWLVVDVMRGMPVAVTGTAQLFPNLTNAEDSGSGRLVFPTATGFQVGNNFDIVNTSGQTYIYIAIRRGPMKTPTSGTSVFMPQATADATTANSKTTFRYTAGFPVDLVIQGSRAGSTGSQTFVDRLRGYSTTTTSNGVFLVSSSTGAEQTTSAFQLDNMSGVTTATTSGSNSNFCGWMLKRAPSFMDEVCYTGTGTSGQTYSHNLGAVPEMMIVKQRNAVRDWVVYIAPMGNNYFACLNDPAFQGSSSAMWNDTTPTNAVFTVGTNLRTNVSGGAYVAYLFASCPGVSKVGSYTGNGSSQTINCGFTGGARFVMIKRTDSTGDWYVWDTARGIVSANDPRLSLNSTAAEVTTDDSIDPDNSGFIVNQVSATNINVSSATYIYLAIA